MRKSHSPMVRNLSDALFGAGRNKLSPEIKDQAYRGSYRSARRRAVLAFCIPPTYNAYALRPNSARGYPNVDFTFFDIFSVDE